MAAEKQKRKASLSQIFRGNNHFIIDLVCPDNTSISRSYSVRDTVTDVLHQSCRQLGIKKTEIFGVAVHEYNEYRFLSNKKNLYKFLPGEAIVPFEQVSSSKNDEKSMKGFALNNNTIKSCRLYLRVRIFPQTVDFLSESALYHFTEQVRLDAIRYQNWLQFPGLTDTLHEMAAIGIWLKYGESSINLAAKQCLALHYYLPISDQDDTTWTRLKTILQRLNDEYGFKGISITKGECLIAKLPLTKSDSLQSSKNTTLSDVTEDDVIIVDDREIIMTSLVSKAKKLPFYGTHFYHVSMATDDIGKNLTNCKLGIGPYGISVVVSPFYTTWKECLNMKWGTVGEIKFEENVLHVSEKELRHAFVCMNEKEARYLFRQLKEMNFIHLSNMNNRRVERTKRNSIGVMNLSATTHNKNNNSLSVSPRPKRTLSFNLLLLPRKFSN